MGITSAELEQLAERCGLECTRGPASSLWTVLEVGGHEVALLLATESDGRLVKMRTFRMLHAPDESYRRAVLSALLEANYRLKLVKFGYDPEDGEISACVDLVVADGGLTDTQFRRCIRIFRTTVMSQLDRLEKILTTGEDAGMPAPEPISGGDLVELLGGAGPRRRPEPAGDGRPPKPTTPPAGGTELPDLDAFLRDLLKNGE